MPDTKKCILQEARDFVYRELKDDSSGHDWWHIVRVANNAVAIAEKEGADLFICELAALLHDIADGKLNESEKAGLQKVEQWLSLYHKRFPKVTETTFWISFQRCPLKVDNLKPLSLV